MYGIDGVYSGTRWTLKGGVGAAACGVSVRRRDSIRSGARPRGQPGREGCVKWRLRGGRGPESGYGAVGRGGPVRRPSGPGPLRRRLVLFDGRRRPALGRSIIVAAVPGLGGVGDGLDNFWDNIVAGKGSIAKVTHFDVDAYTCSWRKSLLYIIQTHLPTVFSFMMPHEALWVEELLAYPSEAFGPPALQECRRRGARQTLGGDVEQVELTAQVRALGVGALGR